MLHTVLHVRQSPGVVEVLEKESGSALGWVSTLKPMSCAQAAAELYETNSPSVRDRRGPERVSKRVLYKITHRQGKVAKIRASGAKLLVFVSHQLGVHSAEA